MKWARCIEARGAPDEKIGYRIADEESRQERQTRSHRRWASEAVAASVIDSWRWTAWHPFFCPFLALWFLSLYFVFKFAFTSSSLVASSFSASNYARIIYTSIVHHVSSFAISLLLRHPSLSSTVTITLLPSATHQMYRGGGLDGKDITIIRSPFA